MKKEIIDAIETKLGYVFSNKALLIQAFTRESYAKEQRVKGIDSESNEQLEYFGDSVLNYLVVSGQLDHFTKVMESSGLHVLYKEGKLSEFNSSWTDKKRLSLAIEALDIAQYLIMSKGDMLQKAYEMPSVKEDLFEALVGAMWIDSGKDVSRIEEKVFKMLGITFEIAEVEKNYVSQLVEYADKHKYPLKSEIKEIIEGYEVKYTITLTFLPKFIDEEGSNEQEWYATGVGRNIKSAEQDAAKELIKTLEEYGWFNSEKLPDKNYTLETAINNLQELNQKGYIGEITYSDALKFSSERKPYWEVTCKISNYTVNFTGYNESKKMAKKEAARSALNFIYNAFNSVDGYNPENKYFKFLVNYDEPTFKVMIIDQFDSNYMCRGRIFPDDKEISYFYVNKSFETENGEYVETYDDPIEAILEWARLYGFNGHVIDGNEGDFKLYLQEEYNKLPEEVKNNGVLLRNALMEIVDKFN